MSSYDKVVKLACKPKAAPPKAKYLDTIIAATWSEDGAVHDVCKALSPRFREPNAIIVFKALIVLHTMIRNGATDNVLSYLSSSDVLRLRNVSAGNWEGYTTPQNLQNYAVYLDSRIRAYRDLKHDAVRVQAESNRDMRNSQSIEEDNRARYGSSRTNTGPSRSKTIMGRKLRVMTVEKGLLRETKAVHRMIDALVECRFYLDDLEDELIITALRMLVKDLLILFQAGNEGVINVLEHYFEMSHIDAQEALVIYRHFCNQTERVVEYLGVAKKLQNLLNVPIPNLKHAPVSLAGALQEYLDDPNFEQNRLEYRAHKQAAEKGGRTSNTASKTKTEEKTPKASTSPPPGTDNVPASTLTVPAPPANMKPDTVVDFFASIEDKQPTMFNPQTGSPNGAYFQQQAVANPFVQMQMMTGQPVTPHQPVTSLQMPHQFPLASSPNPFSMLSAQQQMQAQISSQPSGHRPFSSYLPPQATGPVHQAPPLPQQQPTGFLQVQPPGQNPFRQSMLVPQTTGMALFGVGVQTGSLNPTQPQAHIQSLAMNPLQSVPLAAPNISSFPSSSTSHPFSMAGALDSSSANSGNINVPARPASTPLTSLGSISSTTSPPVQFVKTHQTGTKNPFGPIVKPPSPVPKQPTLMELGMGLGGVHVNGVHSQGTSQKQQPHQRSGVPFDKPVLGFSSSALSPGATDMSGVASSFTFNNSLNSARDNKANSSGSTLPSFQSIPPQDTSSTSSIFSVSSPSTLLTQSTGVSSAPSSLAPSLKPHITGFGGIKPFKPTSAFGASLLESLPPIPGSVPNTPSVTGAPPLPGGKNQNTNPGAPGTLNVGTSTTTTGSGIGTFGTLSSMSSLGQGLRPQMTGGGVANPFRASMMAGAPSSNSVGLPNGSGSSLFASNASPAGTQQALGSNVFTAGPNVGGSSFTPGFSLHQQQNSASLI